MSMNVDDPEIVNPVGTSRKTHKLCAVFCFLANIPAQYRSSLHVIQLALLCKVTDVNSCNWENPVNFAERFEDP